MAKILYGVHGTGHGHAMRALTIARALPQHEFLFVANDDAPAVLEPEFKVVRLPNLGTSFKNYRVDFAATLKKGASILFQRKRHINAALRIMEDFQPDVCMTDLEYFIPRAAEIASLPCLTLDHQHILTCFRHDVPHDMLWDMFLQGLTPKYLFRPTRANIIISFYQPETSRRYNVIAAPPILRKKVLEATPREAGHVLVYQSNSTDKRLIEFIKKHVREKAYVFGYGNIQGSDGNITFMPKSEDKFLELLAGAKYVIQGGSHTLMSEALHLGKPIISIPIKAMVEQRLNAFYLQKLGYGATGGMEDLNEGFIKAFEEKFEDYKRNIAAASFCGNQMVFDMVDDFARTGNYPRNGNG